MSDSIQRVREIADALGLVLADDRLEAVAEAWETALAEAEMVRTESTPLPTPSPYDPRWSEEP